MRDAAKRAASYVGDMTLEEFRSSTLTQDAVMHCLSVIGEAAKWVEPGTRERLPQIEWRRIIGMRNFLMHEYWSTDLNMVWATAREQLQTMIEAIESLTHDRGDVFAPGDVAASGPRASVRADRRAQRSRRSSGRVTPMLNRRGAP